MPHKYYPLSLTDEEILALFEKGQYQANLKTGEIYSKERDKLKIRATRGREKEYLSVRFYKAPKTKEISVGRLIWMLGTGSLIPEGFEIHHKDGNPQNNSFDNLYALHPIDHLKLHNGDLLEEVVPF